MKKICLLMLFLIFSTGCTVNSGETPEPLKVNPPIQDTSDISVEESETEQVEEEVEVEVEEELPIYPDEFALVMTILAPDSIGTVYIDATYKNNSEYPITAYSMEILLKDANEKTYLTNHDTVLPGETSPKFQCFGPETRNIDDIEKLTLSVTALTEEHKKLYIDYDFKLDWAEWFYAD